MRGFMKGAQSTHVLHESSEEDDYRGLQHVVGTYYCNQDDYGLGNLLESADRVRSFDFFFL